MKPLPHNLYRAAQVRELDRTAIKDFAIGGYTLMQRAGQAAFDELRSRWPKAKTLLVLTGSGNNGGDGYVIARLAREANLTVRLMQMGDVSRIQGDALKAKQAFEATGGMTEAGAAEALPEADVIVDALLGTGLEREVRDDWRQVIVAINKRSAPVLAVDIPSGLHSDTGTLLGIAVRAETTVSFIGLKQGLFTGQAADYCGEIRFDDLNVPEGVYAAQQPSARRISRKDFKDSFLPRSRISHKGDFGHVLVVGGDSAMAGAVRLAAEAAARTGAGLVSIATRSSHAATITAGFPVAMVSGVDTPADLSPLLEKASVIAVGPGMGRSDWARGLLSRILDSNRLLVVDADALNMLSHDPVIRDNWVLTPHPAEAARLLGVSTATVQSDRFAAAERLQVKYGGVCVLKGAGTLIRSAGRTSVCNGGNPGMATGGMGDVLTGIIAGLLAQGMKPKEAAEAGVCLHADAADRAAQAGERGMLATDLFLHLRRLVNP